jgi:hypothetical protein
MCVCSSIGCNGWQMLIQCTRNKHNPHTKVLPSASPDTHLPIWNASRAEDCLWMFGGILFQVQSYSFVLHHIHIRCSVCNPIGFFVFMPCSCLVCIKVIDVINYVLHVQQVPYQIMKIWNHWLSFTSCSKVMDGSVITLYIQLKVGIVFQTAGRNDDGFWIFL